MKKDIGSRLRETRLERGLKAKDVAINISITPSALSDLEHGRSKPSWTTLERLCDLYNVPMSYILCEEDTIGTLIDKKLNQINLSDEDKIRIADKIVAMIKLLEQ